MTRYTINIGDDFPLGGDAPPPGAPPGSRHRRRRHGLFLRVLFFLAIAAIVIAHPLKTLLVVGVVLMLTRSTRFADLRGRLRDTWRHAAARDWQSDMDWCRERLGGWQDRWRHRCADRRPQAQAEATEEHDRYRGFV